MGVMANVKGKLGEVWYRLKAWAHSVPPDVWIGLAIAAATLIVVYLAYKKAGGSSSTVSGTDTGIPIDNLPVSGGSSSSSSLGPLPTIFDFGPSKGPVTGDNGNSTLGKLDFRGFGTPPPDLGLNAALQNIYNQNEANGQNATIRAFQQQQAATQAFYNSSFPDESAIAKIIQRVKPQPTPSVIKHPMAVNPVHTGRGVDVSF